MKKVFLGGTVDGFNWRKVLCDKLSHLKNVELFNPIVDKWDEEARKIENHYKENCDISLYVITPFMNGCYSIAEVVDDSNKRPEKTVFVYISKITIGNCIHAFTEKMGHSMKNVAEVVERNGGKSFNSMDTLVKYLEDTLTQE